MNSSQMAYAQGALAILAVTFLAAHLMQFAFQAGDLDRDAHTQRHEVCVEAGFAGYTRGDGCVGERIVQ